MKLHDGLALKNAGIRKAISNNMEFVETMRLLAIYLHRQSGNEYITIDPLRAFADERGIVPQTPNAWGGVFRKAPPGWKFTNTGRTQISNYTSNHGRRVSIFKIEKDA